MRHWLAACGALGAGASAVWLAGNVAYLAGAGSSPLAWEAARWIVRPWTLWTSAWVHLSAGELLANLLALLAIAVAGAALRAGRAQALALLLAWPLGTAWLAAWPEVTRYSGLSGPVHAAAMVLWAHLALRGIARPLSFVVFVGMAFKLLAEHAWSQPLAFDPDWGTNIVMAAHLTGAGAGALCGLVAAAAAMVAHARAVKAAAP